MNTHFIWQGHSLRYFDDPYNSTILNERAIEVPIALAFMAKVLLASPGAGPAVLEVGNVLGHYGVTGHHIVDRHEIQPGVENADVFDIGGEWKCIVAISTLEHVRWDEEPKEPNGGIDAIAHLRSLLAPGGKMLVTVPFGWQPFLDSAILNGELDPTRECSMVRVADGWEQTPTVEHRRYAASTQWAESVWVAEFEA